MNGPDIRSIRVQELKEAAPPKFKDEARVFLTTDAFDRIVKRATDNSNVEVGGVLIGGVFRDDIGPFVLIRTIIDAAHAVSGQTGLTFTHATWTHINEELEAEHAGEKIVGWYHTHPGFGIFLSEQDTFIHASFFDQPFHVAFVYDPQSREHGMFAWRDGEVVRLRKYWVGDRPCLFEGATETVQGNSKARPRASAPPRSQSGIQRDEEPPHEANKPTQDDGEHGWGAIASYLTAAVVVAALGGVGGYYLGIRNVESLHDEYEKAVMKARLDATKGTLRSVRTDLVTVVRHAVDHESSESADRIATHLDRARARLGAPASAGSGAGEKAPPPPDPAAVNAAREEVAKARELLADYSKKRRSASNMLRALDEQAARGSMSPTKVQAELASMRARLGQTYAEMADLSIRVGDKARASRLLKAAMLTDPANAGRYRKSLAQLEPSAAAEKNAPAPDSAKANKP
jgi:proteasome lid subunit RPN8/RPN11